MKNRNSRTRLYVVAIFFMLLSATLWVRLIQVQLFSGNHYEGLAKNQWKVTREIPPVRGGIFDREGRPLALSIRSCSVGARPAEIENTGQVAAILAKHLGLSKRAVRKKLRSDVSFVWIKRQCALSETAQSDVKALRGVDLHWEADRIYPYSETAAKLVGFIGHDNVGMAGIEAAFDDDLSGAPGWEVVQRDGTYRSRGYHTYAQQKPVDGNHVVLTIDAELQQIAESELKLAIASSNAKAGAAIVLDCRNGDVLSLAEYPAPRSRRQQSLVDSLWTIRSVSHMYEPGSTFKLVTAGALLQTNKVKSTDVFDGENGRSKVGAAVISDSHGYGHLTFREGFVYSSNIVMAKASQRLKPAEFLEYIRLFGLGAKTGVQLLGESPGSVAPVEDWSNRTQITMAFGQEIAVTPLQMANTFATVANDGVLMVPRIVKSIVNERDESSEDVKPVKVRRVLSKQVAHRLRSFCRAVVTDGTGTEADLSFMSVSGKTGTAEKASRRGGYHRDKFVASFVGFAPHENPKVVCLVLLDEPSYNNRFGGVSAAPVVAKILQAIGNSSAFLDDALMDKSIATAALSIRGLATPNFLGMGREEAMARSRQLELNTLCQGEGGNVTAQSPGPGSPMGGDDVVRLTLGGGDQPTPADTPDLRGMSMRLAKRQASQAGFRCEVVGSGFVSSQKPAPGQASTKKVVRIFCKSKLSNNG